MPAPVNPDHSALATPVDLAQASSRVPAAEVRTLTRSQLEQEYGRYEPIREEPVNNLADEHQDESQGETTIAQQERALHPKLADFRERLILYDKMQASLEQATKRDTDWLRTTPFVAHLVEQHGLEWTEQHYIPDLSDQNRSLREIQRKYLALFKTYSDFNRPFKRFFSSESMDSIEPEIQLKKFGEQTGYSLKDANSLIGDRLYMLSLTLNQEFMSLGDLHEVFTKKTLDGRSLLEKAAVIAISNRYQTEKMLRTMDSDEQKDVEIRRLFRDVLQSNEASIHLAVQSVALSLQHPEAAKLLLESSELGLQEDGMTAEGLFLRQIEFKRSIDTLKRSLSSEGNPSEP